jgi:putative sigma-54 modulation protein
MKIVFRGKHIEVTDAIRNYIEKRLNKIERHFDHILEVIVTLSVEKNRQIVEVTLQASRALQIQKYKEKYFQRPHPSTERKELVEEGVYVEDGESNGIAKIVKTKRFAIKPMSVEEAAMQMDLLGHSFFVFANDNTNKVNVIYKRKDGNFGLIEPEF